MPYTKEELQNLTVYTEFRDKLRIGYIKDLINAALNFFRTNTGVLLSYEDIDTGLGIENANLVNNPTYSTLPTELNRQKLEAHDFGLEQSGEMGGEGSILGGVPPGLANFEEVTAWALSTGATLRDIYGNDYIQPAEGFIKRMEYSKSVQQKKYPKYDRKNINTILDRDISELVDFGFATTLPEGVSDGDIITSDDAENFDKWLIDSFQKRRFPNLYSFWGEGYSNTKLVQLTMDEINSIPDGEDLI